jgi:arylsulfatase A-like enzyme
MCNTLQYLVLLIALAFANKLFADSPTKKPSRPNIIVVMADDMGFSDLGCYGGEIKTPTIDRLAKDGLRFSQFYNCAICGPSRASLMTGCYPWNVGQAPGTSIFANLKKNCVTVMQLLKANGYKTCAVGRLDMVTAEDWHDPTQVVKCADRVLGSASGGAGNYYMQAKGTPWFKNGKRFDRPVGDYSTDLISSFVEDFIEEAADSKKPFFIYVSHYAPHWPLQASEFAIAPYREMYGKTERTKLMHARLNRLVEAGLIPAGTSLHDSALKAKPPAGGVLAVERMAIHAAMVESIDNSLLATLSALEKTDKLDNTLILVLSDNGASHQAGRDRKVPPGIRPGAGDTFLCQGSALAALNNTPFRNYKTSNYEGGIASPLVAWWPQGIKNKGGISHRLTHIADIMPTCLELARVTPPTQFGGRKLIPLAGESFASILNNLALNNSTVKRDKPRVMVWPKAIRQGRWKLVIAANAELYNISDDRNEQHNLAAQFPDFVKELKQLHAQSYQPR